LLAQKEAINKERQQAIANAKVYSEQLKKEEETKVIAQNQQAEAQKIEAEKKIALQKQAIAEAKNRDIQSTVESEKITTTNPSKNQNIGSKVEENDYYLVKKGDGLYSIAKNNNLTVEELKSINSLKNNVITEGQKLIVKKSNNYNDIEKAIVNTKNSEVKESSDLELIANVNKEKVKKDKFSGIEKVQTNVSNTETENLRLARIAKAKATLEKLKKDNEQYKIAYVDHSNSNNIRQEVTENFNINNQANNCNRNINGYIKNSITKKIIANAKIELFFEGKNLETASTNANGEFFFNNVACDTKYTIICFKEGFDNIAKAVIDTKTATKDITILIQPNDNNAIASNNQVIDAKKTYEVVKKTDPIKPKTTVVNTKIAQNKVKKEEDEMTYYVEPEEIVVPKISEGKVILNPIYFDLDEWYLTAPARRELDKIILLMKLNPTLIIESGSHTDTQGSFDYNLNLSEKRSQETVGYLIANGADPDRISGRGYGETMPTNHCLDGVKCSQKQHFENRRTEFVILKQ
jgi:outer membrane protein OmpA-like peptidoglycan-associated protein/LysM repeat protein